MSYGVLMQQSDIHFSLHHKTRISNFIIYYIVCSIFSLSHLVLFLSIIDYLLQEVTYSAPIQSIYNDDYFCDVSSIVLYTRIATVFQTYQQQKQILFKKSFTKLWKESTKTIDCKLFFSVTTKHHSLGALQDPSRSNLYSFYNKKQDCRYYGPGSKNIEGSPMSNFHGWLQYRVSLEGLSELAWSYGVSGYSRVTLIYEEQISRTIQIMDPKNICDAIAKAALL